MGTSKNVEWKNVEMIFDNQCLIVIGCLTKPSL
jgi:hypothetical protein